MIPVSDSVRSRTFPYVNVAIIVVNLLVFMYEVYVSGQFSAAGGTRLDSFIMEWGNIPACTFDSFGIDTDLTTTISLKACDEQGDPRLTLISAMFMHSSWLHILGNMLFLWIFGDNVEDAMGHTRYLLFYVITGVAAGLTHGLVDRDSLVPAIGASGAIAGVMGGYIVLYPKARVSAFLGFFPLPLPAFVVIGSFFLIDLFRGVSSLGADTASGGGVAYFAHVGGLVAGVVLLNLFMLGRRSARQRKRDPFW